MRVLITGAAGFLGRWFTNHHLAAGDDVQGVDDMSNPHSYWPALPPLRKYAGDAASFFSDYTGDWFDLAYHFAAPVGGRMKIEHDPLFNADSLRLDSVFFRWATDHARTAVYPSSSAVYGVQFQTAGMPMRLTEHLFDPRDLVWPQPDEIYGFTKMAGEVLAWKAAGYGLNTLCIRPFSGYGEGQSSEYPVPSICARAKAQENPIEVWGSGTQVRDFIHVEDLVRATQLRLAAGVEGYQSMNIGSGVGTSFNEIARLAATLVGYEPHVENDASKPQGVSNRVADISRQSHYFEPTISLSAGIARVLVSI